MTGVENPREQARQEYINSRLEYRGMKDKEEEQYSLTTDIYDQIKEDLYGGFDLENEEMPNDNNYYDKTMKRYTDYQNKIEEENRDKLINNIFKIGALAGITYFAVKMI